MKWEKWNQKFAYLITVNATNEQLSEMMEDYQYSDDPDNLDLSRGNIDEDDEEKEISPSTKEAATAAKAGIERFYKNLFNSIGERELR